MLGWLTAHILFAKIAAAALIQRSMPRPEQLRLRFVSAKSVERRAIREIKQSTGAFHGKTFTVDGDEVSCFAVFRLLLCRCPSAVVRRIAEIAVLPINAMTRRALAHIFNESRKTVLPAIANGYPFASVARIASVVFIVTTRFHAGPYLVLPAARLSMCNPALQEQFEFVAAAAFSYTGTEVKRSHDGRVAAFANA